jgi:peptide/nickel transport system ATP-binding protein
MDSAGSFTVSDEYQSPPVHLVVEHLCVSYRTKRGWLDAVQDVSFDVPPGGYLGLVGESACGKTTVLKALLRLLPPDARVTGRVLLDGADILAMSPSELRQVRWTKMAFIAQSAMNALDPVWRIEDQIIESIKAHVDVSAESARRRADYLFRLVGLSPKRLREYPHQFSGGMRQRTVIAMALSLNAGLLLADEPTTALDPIMQDQIIGRIRTIQELLNRSMILVTHDIAVVSETCDSIAVMYAGRIVERGAGTILTESFHPYTMGLRNALPTLTGPSRQLISIPGNLPDALRLPAGCKFAERCPFGTTRCRKEEPALGEVAPGHFSACFYPDRVVEFRTLAGERETWDRVASGGNA